MNNLLKESLDNVFITSANILDKLTYKVTPAATDTVIPHNNDSLMKPLTKVLKKDFDVYNQVLDDFNLELQDAEYALNYLKVKIKKEAEQRQKQEEEERLKKQKADEEADRERARQEQEQKRRIEQEVAASAAAAQQQIADQESKMDFGGADDPLLDLDLGNFNFDGQSQNDLFDGMMEDKPVQVPAVAPAVAPAVEPIPSNSRQPSLQPQSQTPLQSKSQQGQGQGDEMDMLNDLNLDFLDGAGDLDAGMSGLGGGGTGAGASSTKSQGPIAGAIAGANAGANSGNPNAASNNNLSGSGPGTTGPANAAGGGGDLLDDDSLMPPDQMEHLFSQFDELVGGDMG